MLLEEIVAHLERAGLEPKLSGSTPENIEIDQLTADSRQVRSGGLFVAIRGTNHDGHLFIDKAVINGAIAIVHEAMPGHTTPTEGLPSGIASVCVSDSSAALGEIAAALTGHPSSDIACIGVTGTNGKTTTSYLVYQLLESLGRKSGLIGTIEYRSGDRRLASTHTTPDAVVLQKLLAEMREERCTSCAMEVSSHALVQHRTAGVAFRAGVFTNLTQDHLDYHGTMEAYREAKQLLFNGLSSDAVAITNIDDAVGQSMVSGSKAAVTTYGQSELANIRFEIVENGVHGLTIAIDGRTIRSSLVGRFNAYNLTATYATAVALGFDPDLVAQELSSAEPVPGRFERVLLPGGPVAVVDYAHTPDALENVLTTARDLAGAQTRIVCVFGCGGDRDATKRPLMGSIAERLADHVIVTNDNPRTEDPMTIFADIRRGMADPDRSEWEFDRKTAIRQGVQAAGPDGIVVVAGKGHENYQINGTEVIPFDDREVLRSFADASRGSAYD